MNRNFRERWRGQPIPAVQLESAGFRRNALRALSLGVLLLLPIWPPAQAQVSTTDDSAPGSLRDAVGKAAPGATITFAPSLSGKTIQLTDGEILLLTNLMIDASSLPAGIVLDGQHASRIFETANIATNVLTCLTLTNGYAASGGAILNRGNLTLNRCTVAGNAVSSGGGGGGIYNNLGLLILNECTVAGNSATAGGGAGGGIFNLSGGAPVTLNQCTVSANSAGVGGGFNCFNVGPANVSPLALFNTILAGNVAPVAPDLANSVPYQTGVNLIGGDPVLAGLGNYGGPTPTMPPARGSPAIGQGDASATNRFSVDQRGYPRASGSRVDIGAVELQAPIVTSTADSGPGSLRFAVTVPPKPAPP